jgi:alpha-ribazole phosphatase
VIGRFVISMEAATDDHAQATEGKSSVRLWVARHAPALDATMCYGRTDVAVQIAPENAAESLLASYRGDPPRHVWSSPASRCRLVAERLAATLGVPLTVHDALGELHFGAWEGRSWTTIQTEERAAYSAWMNDWERIAPPGGELPADIEARVRVWLGAVPCDRVQWVIAHSGVVRALRVVIERCSWLDAMRREVLHLTWTPFSLPISRDVDG